MSTTTFSLADIHENRELVFPDHKFNHPLSDEQFMELTGLLRPVMEIGAAKSPDWREGHRSGLLMAVTLLRRSSELHPDHDESLNAL